MKHCRALLFLCLCTAMSCAIHMNPSTFEASSAKFYGSYDEYVDADEQVVATWYNYVTTLLPSGDYRVRTFFPETKQIISDLRYTDKTLAIAKGKAQYWNENGNRGSEGLKENNLRVGSWKYYHRNTDELSAEGVYIADRRTGQWKHYDAQGRLSAAYTYQNGLKEGSFVAYDTLGSQVNMGVYKADTIYEQTRTERLPVELDVYKKVDQMPYLAAFASIKNERERKQQSDKALLTFIYKNLKYPTMARDHGIQGMTVTQFVIDTDGSISNIDVIKGICQPMKDEVYKVVSKLPKWAPGIQDGKKVKVLYTLPIKFKLAG